MSFSVHNSTVRGLRWLGNSRLVSFSYNQVLNILDCIIHLPLQEYYLIYVFQMVIMCFCPKIVHWKVEPYLSNIIIYLPAIFSFVSFLLASRMPFINAVHHNCEVLNWLLNISACYLLPFPLLWVATINVLSFDALLGAYRWMRKLVALIIDLLWHALEVDSIAHSGYCKSQSVHQ